MRARQRTQGTTGSADIHAFPLDDLQSIPIGAFPLVEASESARAIWIACSAEGIADSTERAWTAILRHLRAELRSRHLGTLSRTRTKVPLPLQHDALLLRLDVFEAEERIEYQIQVEIGGANSPAYLELKDDSTEALSDPRVLALRLADILFVLGNTERVQQMLEHGTSHPIAYLRLATALEHRHELTRENLLRVSRLLSDAIKEDPTCTGAYETLVDVHHDLSMVANDARMQAEYAKGLRVLLASARNQSVSHSVLERIETRLRQHNLVRPGDAEALWRAAASTSTTPSRFEWLRRYGDLLCGAGWASACEQIVHYLMEQLPEGREWLEMDLASIAGVRNDRELEIAGMLTNIQRFPEFTVSLYGLVEGLACVGRFAEAEAYLARLEVSDATGVWANAARLSLRTFRGELPSGSKALAEAINNPLTTNIIRGRIALIRGDVTEGIRHWRQLEPAHAPLVWQFLAQSEHFFAPGVVENPGYRALLDELGLGEDWVERLRVGFNELARIYGLQELSEASVPLRRGRQRFDRSHTRRNRSDVAKPITLMFTPAEQRLLSALQRGLTAAEYARQSSRSIHTVRNQLKQLLHKTGSRRQADLLRQHPGSPP